MDAAAIIRLGAFAAVLLLLAALEAALPRRRRSLARRRRWPANLLMPLLGSLVTAPLALIGPLTALAAAEWARARGIGLLHQVSLPPAMETAVAVAVLDLAIYWQHRVFHRVPLLWRLHRVHHADPELDVSTGVRFHPLEYLLSMLWKAAVVTALGAGETAVIAFTLILNLLALFNHANLRLPPRVDRRLRMVIVTPDFHAVHHSRRADEHHRNFGFNLAWWDYIFGTYRARAHVDAGRLAVGLGAVCTRDGTRAGNMLLLPIVRPPADE